LKDLKAKIQEELLASKEKEIRRELTEEIMDQISQNLSLELPESLVEQEFKSLLNRLLTSYSQQGINLDNKAIESIQADTRKQAEKNLKNHLILKKISEKEGLAVTEEEVDEELKNIAKANNLPLARVVDSFNQAGRREDLKDNLLIKKTVDFLIRCAIII
jgi:trigger factor